MVTEDTFTGLIALHAPLYSYFVWTISTNSQLYFYIDVFKAFTLI